MSVGAVNKETGERIPTAGMPAIDSVLSGTSTNPVQNRVVKEALDEKADTDIVASDFSASASYTAGDYCIYEGKFYKFKATHSGSWAAADVDEIKIAGELSSLMSGLTGVNEKTFFGGFYGKYYRTTKSSIDDIVDNVITATSDDAGYFSCGNKANIVGFGNRQFVFGWTNTEKTFAWIVVCSFNGISVGTRANASTFTFKSLTS